MMGAYSATPLDADGAETPDTAGTSRADRTVSADPDGTTRPGEPAPPRTTAPAPRERTLKTTLSRAFGWVFFVGGIVGAALGIAGLHVEITVAGLILACTAGLILLKLRSDSAVPDGGGQVAEA